jgi:hypothetical protein
MNESQFAGRMAEPMDKNRDCDTSNADPAPEPAKQVLPPLPQEAQDRIGRHLRRVYGDLLAEPMPDRFTKLLEDLAKSERSK